MFVIEGFNYLSLQPMLNRYLQQQIEQHYIGFAGMSENQKSFLQSISDRMNRYEEDRIRLEMTFALNCQQNQELTEKLNRETQELKKAHLEMKTLFENIENVFFSVDMTTKTTLQISPACLTVYGYTQREFMEDGELWYK